MTKPAEYVLSTIPFHGFYCSIHDMMLDNELDSEISYLTDSNGRIDAASACDRLMSAADWAAVRDKYARAYAASFLDLLDLAGEFESMSSPRFYNFETDRLFVNLTAGDVARLVELAEPDALARIAADRFTSCSGFISHYSPDIADWGPVADWDHNQLGTLMLAAAESHEGSEWTPDSELALVEDLSGNGDLMNWLCEAPEFARAMRVFDYLRRRGERATPGA